MNIDIKQIKEGEDSVVIRYKELTPQINRILNAVNGDDNRLKGKTEDGEVFVSPDEILYLESVDDKVFVYTGDKIVRIDGSLNSFLSETEDDTFFRCSKSMIINVGKVTALKSLSSNRIDATMESGEHIIISRRFASEFRRLLKGDR
ncbi:MAG: LytTR family transcriptional regulator DNA-binding domain-containing protein [Lachnospiraceae bacterium]|nr:LytTR family transcriptional regulator DNA-binding domain-containing protein [Lachnospiraceae bacterium]